MLKPNTKRIEAHANTASLVSAFLAKGGEITKAKHDGVGEGLKRRPYLTGKGVYGVKPKKGE